jgi:hypothetical protein
LTGIAARLFRYWAYATIRPFKTRLRSLQPEERGSPVAVMLLHFEVDDYEAWKPGFDQDPAGRAQSGATSHKIARSVDNPNEVFIRVEFPTVDQAKAFRERLLASGALERGGMRLKVEPTVAETAEERSY